MLLIADVYFDLSFDSLLAPVTLMFILFFSEAIVAQVAILARFENYASWFFLALNTCITFDVNLVDAITLNSRCIRLLILLVLAMESSSHQPGHTLMNAMCNSFYCPKCSLHHEVCNDASEKYAATTIKLLPSQMRNELLCVTFHQSNWFSDFPGILEWVIVCDPK